MARAITFEFRLYITGNAPNSLLAVSNLHELCRCHLSDRHRIEVVDLLEYPRRALSDGVFITPTLLKLLPPPELRIVGTLSDAASVLARLGVRQPSP